MIDGPIKHILCAVRGQSESRKTATRAIDLALKHDAKLTFCLIIEAEFLAKATPALTSLSPVYRQLESMGEFSMMILCDRANRRGVKNTDFIIRKGKIPQQIRALVASKKADVLVLGRPLQSVRGSIFTPDEYDRFVQRLQQESGIKVIEVIHALKDSDISQDNSGG